MQFICQNRTDSYKLETNLTHYNPIPSIRTTQQIPKELNHAMDISTPPWIYQRRHEILTFRVFLVSSEVSFLNFETQ